MKKIHLFAVLFICFVSIGAVYVNKDTSYIVIEANTNRVLEGENIDKQMLVASTAKILTAITVIENYDLNEMICVSKDDTLSVGSKVYLKENEYISRRDLLYALMLRSANDAASALSQNNSVDFIRLMNETAKKIGMYNSVFENASGLDEKEYNLSTAYDMAILGSYVSKNEMFVSIASTHTYKCNTNVSNYIFTNKHKLVKNDEKFVWGKTGFTKKSSRVLVSNYIENNMDLIVVTINDSDDWNHHRKLVEGLDDYTFLTLYTKGVYDTKLDIDYYLYIDEDIVIPIKDDEYNDVKIIFILKGDRAELEVYYIEFLILKREIKVYYKNTFEPDLLLDMIL